MVKINDNSPFSPEAYASITNHDMGGEGFFIKGESMKFTFYFLDCPGSRQIREHEEIADNRRLAEAMACVWLFRRWPNFVMLPAVDLPEAVSFLRAAV